LRRVCVFLGMLSICRSPGTTHLTAPAA
jgi:hypothetical protein